ncbi:alanine--glyoxylate aminotransferase family protein [Tissierella sp.]|uniref:pyridoxal-phosphate-dependent aminotransferase family protein n=1 Tax=Tissierella sp. TaxID=41274 RepID=UPI00285E4422|nr:alanine--glyoxylate aminotransferase family protein [Tissierella sp.]MDR7856517.1 alanine--glyoxylate aminotransferase family protein [Tissierella sp.]
MERREYLQIPGPTNIPERILRTLSMPLINHRGAEFEKLITCCVEGLKKVYRTENDILMFPSSGSGALESAIVNFFSPGDTIAAACHGVFSERVADIAKKYGVDVIRIQKEWGQAVKTEEIEEVLKKDVDKKIRAVCIPQNETTSGIVNNIESVGKMMKESGHPALLIVDVVSSLACIPFEMDAWGVDVAITASQKGFMLPPGLSMVAVSERAWKLSEKSTMPKWYWDYKAVRAKMGEKQFPYTPPTTLLFGLKESLNIIEEEGLENIWDRHALMAEATRNAMKAMGLRLFSEEGYESDTVTTVNMPDGIQYKEFARILKEKYGVVIGGGLQKLQGKIFRIGHLGAIYKLDVYAVLGAIEMTLFELGYKVKLGTAAQSMGQTFLK